MTFVKTSCGALVGHGIKIPQWLICENQFQTTWKKGNVLFYDTLSTCYLQLNGILVSKKKTSLLSLHGLLFPISSKGSFICIILHIG